MKIKTKLTLYTSITVLLSVTIIAVFSILSFNFRSLESIENHRSEETEKIKMQLKDIVNIAYDMIALNYKNSTAKTIEDTYRITSFQEDSANIKMLVHNISNITLANLRVLRYGTNGYLWINELEPPYKVTMHATKPELEGRSTVFYIEGTNTNVYEAFADICNESGEGFLEYSYFKPGQNEKLPKMSFIKLFKPLGWVIGTGIYIDNIDKSVLKKTKELNRQIIQFIWLTIFIGVALVAVASFILYYLGANITNAIGNANSQLIKMSKGLPVNELKIERKDEIGKMAGSLNILINGISSYTTFANEIGKGNLDKEFNLLSDNDILGNSLLEMRKSLQDAKEQNTLRKLEDKKQNWSTQGVARFGEILRQNTDNMKEFCYHIISNLVDYIEGNQGGIFIINDDDKNDVFIELLACYAYERKKFLKKRIEPEIGLIGRCIQEQKTIYMTELPDDYINITSGLGHATPKALLIVPLKVNDKIFGVVELAGFNRFEEYIIKFVEEVGESIASTISTTKINIRTNQLLEQSQQQSEEMSAQEEEMRQNMEELQATQEEAGRRSSETQGLLDALNTANLVIEYDLDGTIISVNDNYLKLIGGTKEQLIGTHHSDNIKLTKMQKTELDQFWVDLRNGITKKETDKVEFNGEDYIFVATYTPIFDADGNPVKILKIATDITEINKS